LAKEGLFVVRAFPGTIRVERIKEDDNRREAMVDTGTRRFRRFRVQHMKIVAQTLFAVRTELVNISVAGACLKTEQSLNATHRQLMRLHSESMSLTLSCSVVWENMISAAEETVEKTAPSYKSGVSFISVPSDTLVRLKDFIRRSGVPYSQKVSDSFKPSLLRFHVYENNKAVVYYTKTLPVKKISLGGMLVELPCEIPREKTFLMELFLPKENPPIRFFGRIASVVPAPHRGCARFDTGIEFLDLTPTDKFRLSRFLLFSKIPGEK
jgi:PilZ domain